MGKRGPKSNAPGGYGVVSNGYRRLWDTTVKRYIFEHVIVWEAANGPVPPGFQVHHINGNRIDNRLVNLEALSPREHHRVHSGCERHDGEWWKPCRKCKVMQHISQYYERPTSVSPWCKGCCIKSAVENKRRRRLAKGDA